MTAPIVCVSGLSDAGTDRMAERREGLNTLPHRRGPIVVIW